MILRYLLFVLVLLNTNLEGAKAKSQNWNIKPLKNYFKQVEKERGWALFATGSCNLDEVPGLELYFWAPQKLTVPEARRWYVTETQKVVSLYQSSQKKAQRAFSIDYLNYTVCFFSSKNDLSQHDFVQRISKRKGQILYKKYNHKTNQYEIMQEEPYEEALRLVQEEDEGHHITQIPLPTPKRQYYYQLPSEDAIFREVTETIYERRGIN